MDAAFNSAPFAGYTDADLRHRLETHELTSVNHIAQAARFRAELDRRAKRDAGDTSVMTPGERLRYIKAGGSI